MKDTREIKYSDISDEIFKEICRYVSDYTACMIGYTNDNISIIESISSGTLVSYKNFYGILTAKHVWYNNFYINRKISIIHFSVDKYGTYYHINKKYIKVIEIPNSNVDLCLFQLTPDLISSFKAIRSFYPIDLINEPLIENISKNLWFSIGFPYLNQEIDKKRIKPLRYFTHLVRYNNINLSDDQIELEVSYLNKNELPPKSLGGMSGGGIWNFKIYFDNNNKMYLSNNINEKILVGVNYYQTDFNNGKRLLKGVGPIAIYRTIVKYL